MKSLLVAAVLALALVQQGEPPEFPAGWFCTPRGIVKNGKQSGEHPCHCKNMADPQTSCETRTTNDPQCSQWCHEQHCSCPIVCEKPS